MVFVKKFLSPLFYPLGLPLVVISLGLAFLWFTGRQRLGRTLVTVGFIFLLLGGCDPISRALILSLEDRYPPISAEVLLSEPMASVRWIVVLGGGQIQDPKLPENGRLSRASLGRLLEGIRLHQALLDSQLLLSGGMVFTSVSEAETMAEVSELLGVDKAHIALDAESQDTAEQARVVARRLGDEPFLLVTSASHMARAMALFAKQGLSPIPAPADYLGHRGDGFHPGQFWPTAGHLYLTQVAVHEYLGMAWASITGEI